MPQSSRPGSGRDVLRAHPDHDHRGLGLRVVELDAFVLGLDDLAVGTFLLEEDRRLGVDQLADLHVLGLERLRR